MNDVAGWIAFLAAHGRTGSCPPELRTAIAQKRLEILAETKIKLARENEIASGLLVPAAEAIRQAGEAGGYFMGELERFCRELPPVLAGLTAPAVAQILDVHIERTRTELQAKLAAIG